MSERRERLVEVVRSQARQADVCLTAEVAVLEALVRERFADAGVSPTPDLAVGLMAVSMLLAERTPEFGGDARDVLGVIAALGLNLLGD